MQKRTAHPSGVRRARFSLYQANRSVRIVILATAGIHIL
jgi:hypothetical protein